ncbi:MAG: hypothetical protein V1744_02835 [Candidatus Altiarchaeota archaeon]
MMAVVNMSRFGEAYAKGVLDILENPKDRETLVKGGLTQEDIRHLRKVAEAKK